LSTRLTTAATFVTGMAVGAGLVYLAPQASPLGPPLNGAQPMGPADGAVGPPSPAGAVPAPAAPLVPATGAIGTAPEGAGPAPPPGAGTPEGAIGPPLPAGDPSDLRGATPAGPAPGGAVGGSGGGGGTAGQRADWLDDHLKRAAAMWTAEAAQARTAGKAELAARMDALALSVPSAKAGPPALSAVVTFLSQERQLFDDMGKAGLDRSRIEPELTSLLAAP
jgi:hypothetical protein